ncbi:hypothetical protein EVAR_97914_1 [Eumeta japonica]|uniref:Uncharacterized protein n=1 Tax=Eumeta variegata TaxID=151549 RepID=A0A4C1SWZ2_EUMVA|nr:hypothetical protein EVAR_97914_1 [Eumeta japonica]
MIGLKSGVITARPLISVSGASGANAYHKLKCMATPPQLNICSMCNGCTTYKNAERGLPKLLTRNRISDSGRSGSPEVSQHNSGKLTLHACMVRVRYLTDCAGSFSCHS